MVNNGKVLPKNDTAMDEPQGLSDTNAAQIAIAELDPSKPISQSQAIHGIVSLLWPYSSSSQSVALLIAEPDFRLRRNRGQVRVQLAGAAARAVAQSHIGIGDFVRLSLLGATWTEENAQVKTPGRSVEGDLLFRGRIIINIQRDGNSLASLDVDAPVSPILPAKSPSPAVEVSTTIYTPAPKKVPARPSIGETYDSPFRLSIGSQNALIDPFSEEWEAEERPRKRLRISGQWRYQRGSKSPSETSVDDNEGGEAALQHVVDETIGGVLTHSSGVTKEEKEVGEDIVMADVDTSAADDYHALETPHSHPLAGRMLPPRLPPLRTESIPQERALATASPRPVMPSPPRLMPVESAALDLVSPMTPWARPLPSPSAVHEPLLASKQNETATSTAVKEHQLDPLSEGSSQALSQIEALKSLPGSHPPPNLNLLVAENDELLPQVEPVPLTETEPRASSVIIDISIDEDGPREGRDGAVEVADSRSLAVDEVQVQDPIIEPVKNSPSTELETELKSPNRKANEAEIQSLESDNVTKSAVVGEAQTSDEDAGASRVVEGAEDRSDTQREEQPHSQLLKQLIPVVNHEVDVARHSVQSLGVDSITPEASQELIPNIALPPLSGHRVDQILDGRFLPTPESSFIPPEMVEANTPFTIQQPEFPGGLELTVEQTMGPPKARPSLLDSSQSVEVASETSTPRQRTSDVPESLSQWFTSSQVSSKKVVQRSSPTQARTPARKREESLTPTASFKSPTHVGFSFRASLVPEGERNGHNLHSSSPLGQSAFDVTTKTDKREGLRTKFSYYTPLSALVQHLNPASQSPTNTIDVFAVVTSPTSTPERAKGGPKDYFTLLHITDKSDPSSKIQVQILRPFKRSLPVAHVGDVILLRSFLVKSRQRTCFLLSGEASGWHVWRFSRLAEDTTDAEGSVAMRSTGPPNNAQEECRGPPVEVGAEERRLAFTLREWWLASHDKTGRHFDDESDEMSQDNEENMREEVAAMDNLHGHRVAATAAVQS